MIETPAYTDLTLYLVLKILNEDVNSVTSKNMLGVCVKTKKASSNCKLDYMSCNSTFIFVVILRVTSNFYFKDITLVEKVIFD